MKGIFVRDRKYRRTCYVDLASKNKRTRRTYVVSRWGQSVENLLCLIGRAGRIPIVHHEDLIFIEMIQAGIDCCRNDVLAVVARNNNACL